MGALALAARQAAAETPTFIGVLEGPQTRPPAYSARTHVRIAFRRDGAAWTPMPSDFATPSALAVAHRLYPEGLTWTVVFNGRSLGSIESRSPGALHWYADVGVQVVTTRPVPVVRARAADFSYGSGVAAKVRPLLLVSGLDAPRQWDPQDWRASPLTRQERRLAIAAFRGKVATSERCDRPEQEPARRVSFGDAAVSIVRSYRDNVGEVLLGARLNDPSANCGFFDDETFFDYWFLIDRRQRVRYLDSQMTPLEPADLDHTGRSAWLFFTSRGEDTHGYELFYDNFEKTARFQWTDH